MRVEQIGNATLILGDCMLGMADMVENQFDLAIVDPPYGLDINSSGTHFKKYGVRIWDKNAPTEEYFSELNRVSENQIIWGANNFSLPPFKGFAIWKKKTISEDFSMSMCEIASISEGIGTTSKIIEIAPQGKANDKRIHPTQKPIKLYAWLLKHYAKEGQTILDTHMGSGSSVIACLDAGHPVTAYELDEEYFDAACRRIEEAQRQQKLFP